MYGNMRTGPRRRRERIFSTKSTMARTVTPPATGRCFSGRRVTTLHNKGDFSNDFECSAQSCPSEAVLPLSFFLFLSLSLSYSV